MCLHLSKAATDVPGDAAPIIPNINMGQNQSIEAVPSTTGITTHKNTDDIITTVTTTKIIIIVIIIS